jgi:hypothetical protein
MSDALIHFVIKTVDTEYTYYSWCMTSTDIKLSNEEKRMIMNILKKEWLIWKFSKNGGSREKGWGGNEIHAPCTCAGCI